MSCKPGINVYVPLSLCPEDFIEKYKRTHGIVDVKGEKAIGTTTGITRNRSWEISLDNRKRCFFGKCVIEEIKDEDEIPLRVLSSLRYNDVDPVDGEFLEENVDLPLETEQEVSSTDYTTPRVNLYNDDWQAVNEFEDQRKVDLRGRVESCRLRVREFGSEPVAFFLKCFPMEKLDSVLESITVRGRAKWGCNFPQVDWGLFLAWLGLRINMCMYNLPNVKMYWEEGNPGILKPEFYYDTVMPYSLFYRISHLFHLPTGEGANSADEQMNAWLKSCTDLWQSQFVPGTYLTVDETMVFWTGLGPAHLTYLPRKPAPLGIMFKTLCDSETGILLNAERVEGAEKDSEKKWVGEFKATTACTLRLTEPWHGSWSVVFGDSWFGSCRTAEELWENGLYCIMSVKTGTKGFPKDVLHRHVKSRGDQLFLKVETEMNLGTHVPFYAVGHFDKAPLHLIATCGSSKQGPDAARKRSLLSEGTMVRERYVLEQPEVAALYRKFFPAVDQFNRSAVGPGSVVDVWNTKSQMNRFFAATLGFAETNAYRSFKLFACNVPNKEKMTRHQWKTALSMSLIHNPWRTSNQPERPIHVSGHRAMKHVTCRGTLNCSRCRKETRWQCVCGVVLCPPSTGRTCFVDHVLQVMFPNLGVV